MISVGLRNSAPYCFFVGEYLSSYRSLLLGLSILFEEYIYVSTIVLYRLQLSCLTTSTTNSPFIVFCPAKVKDAVSDTAVFCCLLNLFLFTSERARFFVVGTSTIVPFVGTWTILSSVCTLMGFSSLHLDIVFITVRWAGRFRHLYTSVSIFQPVYEDD